MVKTSISMKVVLYEDDAGRKYWKVMNENDTHGGERYCILHVLLVLLEKCNRRSGLRKSQQVMEARDG